MAAISTMRLSQRELLDTVTITLKMPKLFRARLWLGSLVVKAGAMVLGCGVSIAPTDALPAFAPSTYVAPKTDPA